MILDFRLQVFHTVARRLSFTKAAEELFITQPAVTKHIQGLEQQFNSKLFLRQGNSIALTEAGQVLLQYTRQLTGIYNNLEQEMSSKTGLVKGALNIGASTTIAQYVLPQVLAGFRTRYKDISLNNHSGNTAAIEKALLSGDIDLGFIEGHTRNKQIRYVPFYKDEIVLVAGAKHPLAGKKSIAPADLQHIRLVSREPGSGTLEVIGLALKKQGLKWPQLTVEMQLDNTEAIKSYLLYSDCMAFVSRYAVQEAVNANLFTVIAVKGLKIERPLNLIHLQGAVTPLVALFMKFALHYNLK
jgi:DNA-binding transcriptional LysR family regulator